ncbi:unnamed protein product [Cyprideis torosa]|uniref:Transcription initiation factor TFIID subunit 13 n=1 Tax=Cyprideis torosa TaxID=163714 RepID=A0A7R8WFV2_9CRUS|nr:unnamed protein product [Cyprideis torosa]CAG0891901.1 unnamed protein product [Cyprideis torosa]
MASPSESAASHYLTVPSSPHNHLTASPKQQSTYNSDYNPDAVQGEESDEVLQRKRLFSKEIRCMMYGFGDDSNPYTESVDFLEDAVIHFIQDTTQRAMEVGKTGRVCQEDIVYLVRKDKRKYARVRELLLMSEELKRARKAFDEGKYADA